MECNKRETDHLMRCTQTELMLLLMCLILTLLLDINATQILIRTIYPIIGKQIRTINLLLDGAVFLLDTESYHMIEIYNYMLAVSQKCLCVHITPGIDKLKKIPYTEFQLLQDFYIFFNSNRNVPLHTGLILISTNFPTIVSTNHVFNCCALKLR